MHVTALAGLLEQYVEDQLGPLRERLVVADASVLQAREALRQAEEELDRLEGDVATRDEQIAALRARVAELEARECPEPDPEPEPGPVRTLFGACPSYPGGQSLDAARRVAGKWGAGVAVRQFKGALAAPSTHQDFALVHTSFKPDIRGLARGDFDEQVRQVARATPTGHVLEAWHESDKKVNDGAYPYDVAVAAKNRFYDLVKAENPDVLVANTITGWQAEPKAPHFADLDRWGQVKADILGLDLDGIVPTKLPYPNFEDEVPVALAFLERHADRGYRHYAVPEFGAPRIDSVDRDGAARARWLEHYAQLFTETGALYVCLYEYDSTPGYALTTAAEVDAWRPWVQR